MIDNIMPEFLHHDRDEFLRHIAVEITARITKLNLETRTAGKSKEELIDEFADIMTNAERTLGTEAYGLLEEIISEAVDNITKSGINSIKGKEGIAKFVAMYQGAATNQFSRINTRGKKLISNQITGVVTISKDTLKITIEPKNGLENALMKLFNVSTQKLFDISVIKLTQQNHYKSDEASLYTTVIFSLDSYMELCDVPLTKHSKDRLRRTVKADIQTLLRTRLEWTESKGKRTRGFIDINIFSSAGIKGGNIILNFSPEIAHYLVNAYVMQYPTKLLSLDERNPNAYYVGRKLFQHHSIDNNIRTGTANIISVKALLEWCEDTIPSYDHVINDNRHIDQRIIKPFENALDALQSANIINWEYCNGKKKPLTESQLGSLNYRTFVELYIKFEAIDAPNQTKRLQSNAEKNKPKKEYKNRKNRKNNL